MTATSKKAMTVLRRPVWLRVLQGRPRLAAAGVVVGVATESPAEVRRTSEK